jgi:bacterioferritin B
MLISKKLNDAINAQIGHEFQASMQYLSMAAYYDADALPKLAKFFYKQAGEEHEHGMKFFKYILDAGGEVKLPLIPAPKSGFASSEEIFGLAVEWEMQVTRNIYDLVEIAKAENDYIGLQFLDWFVAEQLEEVSTMENMLKLVKKVGEKNLVMMEAYISHGD